MIKKKVGGKEVGDGGMCERGKGEGEQKGGGEVKVMLAPAASHIGM